MKRIISGFITLCLLTIISACSHNDATQRLQAEIDASNRQCPISLGPSGTLTAVTYNPDLNTVTMHYRMSRYYANPASLANSTPEQKREMAAYLRDEANRPLLNLFNDADASLALSFLIGDATEPVVLTLSSSELHDIAAEADNRTNLRVRLNEIAETENRLCPSTLAEGITATAVMLDDDFLTYEITVPDSVALATSAQQATFRGRLVENLDSAKTDASMAQTVSLLRNLEYGIRYRIFNPADSLTFVIDITPTEI